MSRISAPYGPLLSPASPRHTVSSFVVGNPMKLQPPKLDPLAQGLLTTLLGVVLALLLALFAIRVARDLTPSFPILDDPSFWTLFIAGAGVCVSLLLRVVTKSMTSPVVAPADIDVTPDLFSQAVVLNIGSQIIGAHGDKTPPPIVGLLFWGILVSILVYIYLAQRYLQDGNLKLFLGGTMSFIPLCCVSYVFVGLA